MNLEIKGIFVDEALDRQDISEAGNVAIRVEIGERDKEGSESFHFVAASPAGLAGEISNGGFKLLRGYILMSNFDMNVVRRSIENLINHARSRETWEEVVAFFNRYGVYDSEDLDGNHLT
jgi:hypothetical protein